MGFWKKMTEATITITRFRQLPIECVTGDTRCRIMYDTCDTSAAFRTLQLQCTFVQSIVYPNLVPLQSKPGGPASCEQSSGGFPS